MTDKKIRMWKKQIQKQKHEAFCDWLEEIQESCPVDWRCLDNESPEWIDFRFYDIIPEEELFEKSSYRSIQDDKEQEEIESEEK